MAHTFGAHAYARIHMRVRVHGGTIRLARVAAVAVGVLVGGGAAAQTAAAPTMTPVAFAIDPTAAAMPPDRVDFSLLEDATPGEPIKSASLASPASLVPQAATVGSRNEKVDGSLTLSAGERLATSWDAKVGVDLAAPASAPLPGLIGEDHGTGWADLSVPAAPIGLDKATIDARVDPTADQGTLSTALSRSLPIGDGLSLTLRNGYSVTQTLANPNGLPSPANARVYAGDGGVRLQFPTATALTAGAQMSSIDDRLTPSLTAEQRLFDTPFSITGTISQLPTGGTDRSITAGFRRIW